MSSGEQLSHPKVIGEYGGVIQTMSGRPALRSQDHNAHVGRKVGRGDYQPGLGLYVAQAHAAQEDIDIL